MIIRRASVLLLTSALAIVAVRAQQAPLARARDVVTQGVTAVLVDVVVRDKKGQPVRDLTQADFEVLEDGVPQKLGAFNPVFEGAPVPSAKPAEPSTATAPANTPPPVNNGPSITALVFDRLSPESRRLAVKAAEGYLGSKTEADSYIGIFGIDLGLAPYAPFTRNVRVLRQGLEKIASRSSATFDGTEQRQQKSDADKQAAAAEQTASTAEAAAGGRGGGSGVGTSPGGAEIAQLQASMLHEFDAIERDQQGYATTNGLFAIISTLRSLPGRKSLVLFSEGIAIPPAVERLFAGVIDAANRANVSIYTMDAAGLRTESAQAAIRDEINESAKVGMGGNARSGSNKAPLSARLEKNEADLRQDPHTGLGELAEQTGGLLFDNTNNLRQGFDRIESDLHNYYLLGYTPSNDKYDGRFRTIDVKVKRPGVVVAARKGYFAVRDAGGGPINSWEAPALGLLEQKPVPNAFPVRAGALLFPERDRPGLVPVVVSLKTAPLTFETAPDGKMYTSDFAVLVRFVDAQNHVARKLSQHYEVKGPIADIDRAKQGDVIFYREPELLPGVYSMETIVYDAPSGKSSVRFSTVEVPKVDPAKLRMSSLVLVTRAEKIGQKDRRDDNPLEVNDLVLYPNLGEPISKAAKELGFYFAAYPAQGGSAPDAVLELLQNGKLAAQLPLPLSAVDFGGRIQQVGRLPLAQLAPGTYELRVVVKQGDQQVFRSALLRIVE